MSREEPSWWKVPTPSAPREPVSEKHEPPTYSEPPAYVEPASYQGYVPAREHRPFRDLLARIWAPIAALIGIAVKFGVLGLKFFGIFISVAGYALIWGWRFAIGFVVLIAVHEMGHYVEGRRQGLDPSLPRFIPFFGAYVALKNATLDAWGNALVSLAGPIAGGLGAAVLLAVGRANDSQFVLALAYVGFLLNLFNLLPIGFLDGGHVLTSFSALRRGEGRADPADARKRAWIVAVLYFVTAAALVVGMLSSHVTQHRL
jgi:Zn-dependent protease